MKKHIKNIKYGEKMRVLLLLLISIISGIFAGMGMGGGTFLIPLLSLFFGVEQIICQSTNIICFAVVASICFVIYIKSKLIDFKVLLCVAIPATIIALFSSFFALKIKSHILSICFASFIILIGILSFIKAVKSLKNKSQK